uniref:Uncharacterized protein n=1 Tax=Lotharella oceanica TaxID=641309 RepID=A0A7S2X9G3_9EUKA|mmetsp:Transcript_15787/g.29978  ORF Transcript_15787/g.29978 Transcript_15787/m.29978 type:complete len:275 (+) Transcript_15787:93-917(+)|eukprot:CAMPEP_0170174652 /NCGR_PEP_ID=MMETSP0040_2-20121228/7861_1 /TAXON_ID=641309 /ORGANISM="Lotharella oceanica, Strain CCMP622" /LENGTH=274 /DNA_ID=CAMNT_0010416373 /DNA_START=65 /DNA_END=889 /DNA_ORIENTATION=-
MPLSLLSLLILGVVGLNIASSSSNGGCGSGYVSDGVVGDVAVYVDAVRLLRGGVSLDRQYRKWENRAAVYFSSDDDQSQRDLFLCDTMLDGKALEIIVNFIENDKVIACYSGMGYAELQIQKKIKRQVYCSDLMPDSCLRWSGNLEKDMLMEERRIYYPGGIKHRIPVKQIDALHYIKDHNKDCNGTTLLCFMPPCKDSQFGDTIEAFKRRGGRKIVVAGSFTNEDGDQCGDTKGWEELHRWWDKHWEMRCSFLTDKRLTLWMLRDEDDGGGGE